MVTKDVIENPAIVAGGGAPEVEVSYQVREWAQKLTGREQLAALKFAGAIETIATILAENAGMDPIDTQVELRARHGKGEKWAGVDALSGKVGNMMSKSVVEPLAVKLQILKAATEAAASHAPQGSTTSASHPERRCPDRHQPVRVAAEWAAWAGWAGCGGMPGM